MIENLQVHLGDGNSVAIIILDMISKLRSSIKLLPTLMTGGVIARIPKIDDSASADLILSDLSCMNAQFHDACNKSNSSWDSPPLTVPRHAKKPPEHSV